MNIDAASNLDIERFRKVYALVTGGATEGERAAAKARAEAIAKNAGLTLKQAASKLSTQRTKAQSRADDEAFRQEVDRAKWEAFHAKEAREQKARFEEAVRKHGPAEQAFAETDKEMKLRLCLEPFATYRKFASIDELYVDGFIGWRDNSPNPTAFETLMDKTMPLPSTLGGLIAEWKEWEALFELRVAYVRDYETPRHVDARRDILERRIARLPITGWEDMEIRLTWTRDELERERLRMLEDEMATMDRLEADFAFLRDLYEKGCSKSPHVQTGRRTNADKRTSVLSMLEIHPELSDREISRRVGVSPQTVGNWRKSSRHDRLSHPHSNM